VDERIVNQVERRTPITIAKAALKQLRPKQWAKNVFLFAAIVFSGRFTDPDAIVQVLVGFFSFSMLASSGYIFNDYLDREADKKHPKKKFRPIASGALPVPAALVLLCTSLILGTLAALYLSPTFLMIAYIYLATTLSYSFYFKHKVILDVMFLASGFVWRAIAGAVAIEVHVSVWLFLCTAFISLFLGFGKRRAELLQLGADGGTRKNLAEYSGKMLEQYLSIVTGSTVLCYALYTVLGPTPWMTLTIPCVLYGIFRYIYLVERFGEGGAPDETLLGDVPMILTGILYIVVAIAVLSLNNAGILPSVLP
jgi:4-hydroxybenzoate polyprenyltransferase